LHDAARDGDTERVKQLLDQGTDITEPDAAGEPALLIAALKGRAEVVALLIDRGNDIEIRNKGGLTALHAAAYGGNLETVKLLVAKGAAVNDVANFYKMSPLHAAAEEGHAEVVAFLLANKADIEAKERNGYTPLTQARLAVLLAGRRTSVEGRRHLPEGRACRRMALRRMHETSIDPETEETACLDTPYDL
jgi:ankyrin repeat protein